MIEWNEACLVCMDHRHTEANCAWNTTKPCNVRACYERHHISLHQTVTGRINVIQVIDLTLTDSLLPVMIYTFKDQEQTTTILFDSGSTVSLIEKSCQLPRSQRFPSDYYPVQSLWNWCIAGSSHTLWRSNERQKREHLPNLHDRSTTYLQTPGTSKLRQYLREVFLVTSWFHRTSQDLHRSTSWPKCKYTSPWIRSRREARQYADKKVTIGRLGIYTWRIGQVHVELWKKEKNTPSTHISTEGKAIFFFLSRPRSSVESTTTVQSLQSKASVSTTTV